MSVSKYITSQRIHMAKHLLETTEMSIREIAIYIGIPDWNYLSKLFKNSEGISPSEYRKQFLSKN